MNARSLSFRLVTWYAGLLTLVFLLLGALTIVLLRQYLEANILDTQARRARQIADTLVAAAGRTGDALMARQVDELYSPEANDRFIRITSGDGHVVYASGKPRDGSFDPSKVPAPSLTRHGAFLRKETLSSGSLFIAAQPYKRDFDDTASPTYVVEVVFRPPARTKPSGRYCSCWPSASRSPCVWLSREASSWCAEL
jgi:hypothetical protein